MEEQQIIKRKKGRPKKQKTEEELHDLQEQETKEKKKRGRKKKEVPIQEQEEVKQKKKRGRKAAVKYFSSSIRKKIPLTTVIKDNDNYILHIDIKDEINDDLKDANKTYEMGQENEATKVYKSNDKNQVIESFPKEIKEILEDENEDNDELLSNLINLEHDDSDKNTKELYNKRLEFREKQDELLSFKLEEMHKDENFINQLIEKEHVSSNIESDCNYNECNKNKLKVQESNKKKGFFEIFYDFIHNKEWLHKTDVCCWWCCHNFDTVPLGLPLEYNIKTKKFMVKGVFCSFACVLAYKEDKKLYDKNYLINLLYKKLTEDLSILEEQGIKLRPAPPRCCLKMFGGELSIDEFRNASNEHKIYRMIEYPMCMYNDYVEEVDIVNIKNANSKLFNKESLSKLINLDDKRVHDAQTRLSQVESTVVTTGNTIDKFIKFC